MKKPSISGLFSTAPELVRFENLLFKQIKTATFCRAWGVDWSAFLTDRYDVPVSAFLSYIRQEATKRAIVIDRIHADIVDFSLVVSITIAGVDYQLTRKLEKEND